MEIKDLRDELPKEFPNCPTCGSERRLGDELAKMGSQLPEGGKAVLEQLIIPLAGGGLLTGKVVIVLSDVCLDCGTKYVRLIAEHFGHIKFKKTEWG